jgi:hypothetical protein
MKVGVRALGRPWRRRRAGSPGVGRPILGAPADADVVGPDLMNVHMGGDF